MSGQRQVRVTAMVDHLFAGGVRHALQAARLDHWYTAHTRSSVLEERRGLMGVLAGRDRLASDAGDLFVLYVEEAQEQAVMDLLVEHGRLRRPGAGSVFSESVECVAGFAPLAQAARPTPGAAASNDYFPDLVGVHCIVQRDRADPIAREVLELGAAVPTIWYGTGMGLRDRLGLLRITIPAEKEIMSLVVSRAQADEVLEKMILAGRLDLPGQGFIYSYPVRRGLLNTRLKRGHVGQLASIDRIVAAIDDLTGGIDWRSTPGGTDSAPRAWFSGVDATLIAAEDRIPDLFRVAMAAGAGGATISPLRLGATSDTAPRRARAACNMLLDERVLPEVIEALDRAGGFGDEAQGVLYCRPVERAFTYRASS